MLRKGLDQRPLRPRDPSVAVTAFGVVALAFMLVMYVLERRGRIYVLGFALGCAMSSTYGFLSGAWPFGVVEGVWCISAIVRYLRTPHAGPPQGGGWSAGSWSENLRQMMPAWWTIMFFS
jgi:hypothetical protein